MEPALCLSRMTNDATTVQPFTFHLPLKNSIIAFNKRAIRRGEMRANHTQGAVVSEGDRLIFNRLSSAPRQPLARLPVSGTLTVHLACLKAKSISVFEKNFV